MLGTASPPRLLSASVCETAEQVYGCVFVHFVVVVVVVSYRPCSRPYFPQQQSGLFLLTSRSQCCDCCTNYGLGKYFKVFLFVVIIYFSVLVHNLELLFILLFEIFMFNENIIISLSHSLFSIQSIP